MSMYMMKKLGYALVEIFKTFRRTSFPCLIMTLLVKKKTKKGCWKKTCASIKRWG